MPEGFSVGLALSFACGYLVGRLVFEAFAFLLALLIR